MRFSSGIALSVGAVTAATGFTWLWRNQAEVFSRPPLSQWTFTHMDTVMATQTVPAPRGRHDRWIHQPIDLSAFRYTYRGAIHSLADLHQRTGTTALVVAHRGRIVHEAYPGVFAGPDRRFQLFSLTKSVTSLLVGIAHGRNLLDLTSTVGELLPEFAGSAYASVTIDNLLQMSSGVGDVEDWTVPDALINRFESAVTGGRSVTALICEEPRSAPAGQTFNYSTVDAHILGLVLEVATGMTLAAWASQELWVPLGAENDAYYFLTRGRPRHALGGGSLNATVRDLARVGQLVLQHGLWSGRQIVPADWIDRCHQALTPSHQPGNLGPSGRPHYGYSTQWWLVGRRPGTITGLGVYGQYLWVDPQSDTVIVRTATWPTADDEERDDHTYNAFCGLSDYLGSSTCDRAL